jgi:hypothetical protein
MNAGVHVQNSFAILLLVLSCTVEVSVPFIGMMIKKKCVDARTNEKKKYNTKRKRKSHTLTDAYHVGSSILIHLQSIIPIFAFQEGDVCGCLGKTNLYNGRERERERDREKTNIAREMRTGIQKKKTPARERERKIDIMED